MSAADIHIGSRKVGPGHKPFIIAEVSCNHNGDLARALDIVDMVADAGADAVKLQTYTADTITIDCDRPEFVMSEIIRSGAERRSTTSTSRLTPHGSGMKPSSRRRAAAG